MLFCNVLFKPPHLKSQYMILINFFITTLLLFFDLFPFHTFPVNLEVINYHFFWGGGVRITFPSNHFLYTELAYRCNLWPYQLIVFVYYCDKWPRFLEHVQVLYGSHKDRLGPAPINWQFLIINSITTIQVLDRNLYPYAYLSFLYGLWIIIPTERGPFYCYLGTDICSYKYTQHIKILYPHLYTGNPILIISICNMLLSA